MGKVAYLDITESLSELKLLASKQKNIKGEKRVKALIYIKENKFKTRKEVSNYLGIHIRTLERWVNKYKSDGIHHLIQDKPKNKKSKIITSEIHKGLEEKVNDSNNPFLGYWDAQQWVNEKYGVQIKYQRIREYLKQHFKTKLKTPRKSHYKKDLEAEDAFLKNT